MHASISEVVEVDIPFMIRESIVGPVSSRGGHPYERVVAEVAREVDDDVCVGDTIGIE